MAVSMTSGKPAHQLWLQCQAQTSESKLRSVLGKNDFCSRTRRPSDTETWEAWFVGAGHGGKFSFAWIIPVPCLVWQRVQAHLILLLRFIVLQRQCFFFFFFLTNLKVCGNPVLSGDTLVGNIFKLRYLHYFWRHDATAHLTDCSVL